MKLIDILLAPGRWVLGVLELPEDERDCEGCALDRSVGALPDMHTCKRFSSTQH